MDCNLQGFVGGLNVNMIIEERCNNEERCLFQWCEMKGRFLGVCEL